MSDGYVCPECGLDYDALDPDGIGTRIRPMGTALRTRLGEVTDDVARTRPEPAVFSAVEYAAHVADTFDAFDTMVGLMRSGGSMDGLFWDPDDRAAEQRYNEQPLASVLDDLDNNVAKLADTFDRVTGEDWAITARFPWGERDLLTMARNAVHEGVHHTQDVQRVLERVSGTSH